MNCSTLDSTLSQQGHVYTSEGSGRQDISVSDNKIVAIASSISSEDFPGYECISLDGTIIYPRFIDQHAHLIGGGGEVEPHTRTLEVHLSRLAEAGVMSVVGLLGIDGTTRHPGSLLTKTRALEFENISVWVSTGAYLLPSPAITGSIDRDVALIGKVTDMECAVSGHRSSAPDTSALVNMAAQSRVDGLLGRKPGISVFHMGDNPCMLEPLHQTLGCCDVPITRSLPAHVSRVEPSFQATLEYTRKGGYINITSNIDEPVGPATAIATTLRQNVPLSRITFSLDDNGSQPGFDGPDSLTGIGAAGFESLAETVCQLVKTRVILLEQALCPLTRTVAEFLALEHKGRPAVGCDTDILVLNDVLEVHHLRTKGKTMVKEQKAYVKGTLE